MGCDCGALGAAGESLVSCAVREVLEETRVTLRNVPGACITAVGAVLQHTYEDMRKNLSAAAYMFL